MSHFSYKPSYIKNEQGSDIQSSVSNASFSANQACQRLAASAQLSLFDALKLVLLAAIWGASFILMRLATPEAGSFAVAFFRIMLAAVALLIFANATNLKMDWRKNLKIYALAGLFGAVLPFTLFSYASLYLPAAFSALFNSTCPLFVALFSIFWLAEKLTVPKIAGLILGVLGVALVVGAGSVVRSQTTLFSAVACLVAPACFAISAIIIKIHTAGEDNQIAPLAIAIGATAASALMVLPALPFIIPAHPPSLFSVSLIVVLALIPSALAQIIFVPLLAKIGPVKVMSVSFLIPLFSVLWGFLFLQETLDLSTLAGGGTVLLALFLILKH